MKVLILNGSPRKKGTIATLLKGMSDAIDSRHEIEWINVYDLNIMPCIACMRCRPDGECHLREDDALMIGRKIKDADALIVGTPTHWGNMSSQLKLLFDRNVPVFMGEKPNGFPTPCQKGKLAAIVTACSTPWPFNFIAAESRGSIRAVHEVLHYGGYKVVGKIACAGTKKSPKIPQKILKKVEKIGLRF